MEETPKPVEQEPKGPHKPKPLSDIVITVTLPEGAGKVTAALGKVYHHTLSDEQMTRLKIATHRRTYEVGPILSVHPQRRQLTVRVPGNRVAWVQRVLLGKQPTSPEEPRYESNEFKDAEK